MSPRNLIVLFICLTLAAVTAAAESGDVSKMLRDLADHTQAGMDRRLGPGYEFYHKQKTDPPAPTLYLPPDKEVIKGRSYQIGGPYTKEAGDYSSTQGQILYVPDQGLGVDRVNILQEDHNMVCQKPEIPWHGGFRPEPSATKWQQAAGGNPGSPIGMARGMAQWSNCGVIVFSSGFVGAAGTVTASGTYPSLKLPPEKIPLAMTVSSRNEFAFVAVHDTQLKRGQLAVIALSSDGQGGKFVHEWPTPHPGLTSVGYLTGMKLLGYVDLPGMAAPSAVCAVGNSTVNRMNGPDGNAGLLRSYDLARQDHRDVFLKGTNAHYTSSAGFAVVISRYENKAIFIDLEPLFKTAREMYFTSEENYKNTLNQGPAPDQWPYTFEKEPGWAPKAIKTLDVKEPTAVIGSLAGGEKARALIASLDGTIGIYQVGGLATDKPATPEQINRVGEFKVGRNPVCLNYQKGSSDTFLAVSRGDREIAWFKVKGDSGEVTRRLRDSRMLDPVFVEQSDTHGIETNLITVADFKGRKIINYRCSELVFATQGGARYKPGPDGKDEFECGGIMEFPGFPFCISATNVN